MSSYYYLISSLPMLSFGVKPPFSYEVFLDKCREFIPEKEFDMLRGALKTAFLQRWEDFDTDLRNELVKIRAHRRHIDAYKYLRQERYVPVDTVSMVVAVSRNPSILDSENSLDQIRWDFLEDLAQGHYFDLEFLIAYAFKLRILEKWERINTADKAGLLAEVLKRE